jgi:hypothetical protein
MIISVKSNDSKTEFYFTVNFPLGETPALVQTVANALHTYMEPKNKEVVITPVRREP